MSILSCSSSSLFSSPFFSFGGWDGIESMNDFHRFNLGSLIFSFNSCSHFMQKHPNGKNWKDQGKFLPLSDLTLLLCTRMLCIYGTFSISTTCVLTRTFRGGYGQGKHLTDVYKYEFGNRHFLSTFAKLTREPTETDTWSRVETTGKKPSPRSRLRGVVYGNRMFVLGGYDRSAQGLKGLCKDNFTLNLGEFFFVLYRIWRNWWSAWRYDALEDIETHRTASCWSCTVHSQCLQWHSCPLWRIRWQSFQRVVRHETVQ